MNEFAEAHVLAFILDNGHIFRWSSYNAPRGGYYRNSTEFWRQASINNADLSKDPNNMSNLSTKFDGRLVTDYAENVEMFIFILSPIKHCAAQNAWNNSIIFAYICFLNQVERRFSKCITFYRINFAQKACVLKSCFSHPLFHCWHSHFKRIHFYSSC